MIPMDLFHVLDEDSGDFSVGVEQSLMELAVSDVVLERIVLVAPFGDLRAQGKSEQSMSFEHGHKRGFGKSALVSDVRRA